MAQITVEKTFIDGVFVITPKVHGDARGYFTETYNQSDLKEYGINHVFVQDNQSMSVKGVLRGLHYQKQFPQAKLVRVISGRVFDVAVDLRKNSATFGKWFGVVLSAKNRKQLLIPEGFAHGFLVLSKKAEFCYKVSDFYHANDEGGIAWNDPKVGIRWEGLTGEYNGSADPTGYTLKDGTPVTTSEKDKKWGTLDKSDFIFG